MAVFKIIAHPPTDQRGLKSLLGYVLQEEKRKKSWSVRREIFRTTATDTLMIVTVFMKNFIACRQNITRRTADCVLIA